MRNPVLFLFFTFLSLPVFSQTSNGEVRSLVNTEEYFNYLVKKEGINKGFLKVIDDDCIVFRPDPVKAGDYYKTEENTSMEMSWKPEYAIISKSGDFGFTSGPYETKEAENTVYGHYVSIWKTDVKNRWKLVLDGGITHPKPNYILKYEYDDPDNHNYSHLLGPQKIKMRADIVRSTDILLGKALNQSGSQALNEFYDDTVRLYFPDNQPFIGKQEALKFLEGQHSAISSIPAFADRAYSGDLAYTYGKATISSKEYNYIRIWRISPEKKWNIILDVYIPQ